MVLTLLSFLTAERIRERGVCTVGFWHRLVSSVATYMPTQLSHNLKSVGFPAISGLYFHLPLVVNHCSHSDWKSGKGIFQSWKSQGILNRENHTKYWKSRGVSDKCCLLFFSDI